jgi:hypothetical protein
MDVREGRSSAVEDPARGQIKSRERVRDLAEVYTRAREVSAMLDLVPDMFPSADDPENVDRTFLEPACGSGNFIVAILARKLAFVSPCRNGGGDCFEHQVLRCLVSIYGIDICEENVVEARDRMADLMDAHARRHLRERPTPGFTSAVKAILNTNIIHADALADGAEIEVVRYLSGTGGTFVREWSHALDPAADELNLFSLSEPRRDEVSLHYSELARQPGPAAAACADRAAA